MKNKYLIIIILTLQVLISCKQKYIKESSTRTSSAKNVRALSLEGLEQIEPITATGTLQSKEEIVLSFKIAGIVNRLLVDAGESVKINQQIASINLSEINAQVTSASNAYDKSVRDLERATNLYRDTVGTLEQQQNAKTAMEIANSNLEIARFNRRFSAINSPVTGKVLQRFVEAGELVSLGQPIYKIGSSGTKGSQIIRLGLSDKDVVKITLNDSATVNFDAFAKAEYTALVTEISQSSNPKTGLFEVELTLKYYESELKNGFIATVTIAPSKAAQTFKIPMNALVEGKQKQASIFYTENDATIKNAVVEILDIKDDYFTIITTAIPSGAKVITEGAPYLKVNDSIHIVQ